MVNGQWRRWVRVLKTLSGTFWSILIEDPTCNGPLKGGGGRRERRDWRGLEGIRHALKLVIVF